MPYLNVRNLDLSRIPCQLAMNVRAGKGLGLGHELDVVSTCTIVSELVSEGAAA